LVGYDVRNLNGTAQEPTAEPKNRFDADLDFLTVAQSQAGQVRFGD
jgi:hypothetical protein